MTGTTIGHYRIVSKLGEGGMGAVYRATDTKLGRDVAVKVLPESFASDAERLARFTREAQVLASLNHPNIASIYGVEERALVMELVEGAELKGPVPVETALGYARQIAEALEAAHEKGIVHRDLKPANVLVTADGVVKVLDFGLAKAAEPVASANPANSPTLTMGATEVGLIMGTAGYMAPEQAAGKVVDKRADIWAFGVVLFELVTGEALFAGETVSHTLAHVLTREIDLGKAPAAVRPLLARCLDRDVKTRLRDIGEARVWIQRLQIGPEEPPVIPGRGKAGRASLPWVVAAAGVLAGIGAWALKPAGKIAEAVEFALHVSTASTSGGTLRVSPDGKRIAVRTEIDNRRAIYVRNLGSSALVLLPGTDQAVRLAWSPDGRRIAFTTPSLMLKVITLDTNLVKDVAQLNIGTVGNYSLEWGEAGYLLCHGRNGQVEKVAEAGGAPEPIVPLDASRGETGQMNPAFLPGGTRFLYSSFDAQKGGLYVASLDGGPAEYVGERMDQHFYVKSANGDGLLGYVRAGQLLVRPFDARTARFAGSERLVVAGVAGFGAGLGRLWDSGGGSLAYFLETTRPSDLTWFSRQGEKGAALEPVAGVRAFRLSPDEKALAYGVTKPGEGIRLLNLERGGTPKISFGKDGESYPVWSPEGKWVAYSSRGGEKNRIYRRLADGSGQEETLLEGNDVVYPLSWSPDGKWLLYSGGYDGRWNLYLLPMSGDRKPVPFVVDPFDKYDARFSPDGRLIAYSSNESGVREVYVRPAPGETGLSGRWQISSDGGSHAQWRKDGKELYYWTADQLMAAGIEREATTLRVGKPGKLFGLPSTTNPRTIYEASGDGKRFLVRGSITEDLKAFVVVNWEARGTQ